MKIKAFLMVIICIHTFACTAKESKSSERQEILERASVLIQKGSFNKAYDLLISGAKSNDYEMQHTIALIVSNGYGPVDDKKRDEEALKWVVLFAQGGFQDSINWLADTYENGWFGLKEKMDAADCWRSKNKSEEIKIKVCPIPNEG